MSERNLDHVDFFGQPIEIGDYVTAAVGGDNKEIDLYQIKEFHYMVFKRHSYSDETGRIVKLKLQRQKMKRQMLSTRPASNCVKVDPKLITFMRLTEK